MDKCARDRVREQRDPHKETRMQYDQAMVGAGPGGCALAGRLADRCPDASIALIEAGPHTEGNLFVNLPVAVAA
jgi:choline dehydrogenase-like flavoprotein